MRRITYVPSLRLRTVRCWWVRPRAPIRCQAATSRSALYPHTVLGQLAYAQPDFVLSGALWWRKGLKQRGQYFEVPRAGTMTTAMPCAAAA